MAEGGEQVPPLGEAEPPHHPSTPPISAEFEIFSQAGIEIGVEVGIRTTLAGQVKVKVRQEMKRKMKTKEIGV